MVIVFVVTTKVPFGLNTEVYYYYRQREERITKRAHYTHAVCIIIYLHL